MLVKWNDNFSVGIPVIDIQHKELFVLTNKLNEIIQNKSVQPPQIVRADAEALLKNLFNYSSYHFISEEQLFREYSFPEADAHTGIHNKFRETIKGFIEENSQKQNVSLEYLQDFLVTWIVEHVKNEDGKYRDFFAGQSIQPKVEKTEKGIERSRKLSLWEEKKLSLEIVEIDNQHRELIRILQQTNDLQRTSDERKKIYLPVIIQKLFYYTQYHFSFEEEHMSKNEYPKLPQHRSEHQIFIDKVNNFVTDYEKDSAELTDKIIIFLRDWTVEHILKEDKEYKNYLDSRT